MCIETHNDTDFNMCDHDTEHVGPCHFVLCSCDVLTESFCVDNLVAVRHTSINSYQSEVWEYFDGPDLFQTGSL